MKVIIALILLSSFSAWSQDAVSQLNLLDSKVYSLKTKGVTDFVVDVESSRLTKQVNDQAIFGTIKSLVFKVFWTANPERMAIEIQGLPEGFKEVKEELKASLIPLLEHLLPPTTIAKFNGYKISNGSKPKEFIAQDTTGMAAIPSYVLQYDPQDKLTDVIGKKNVGTFHVTLKQDKESFSDGKWVLEESVTESAENGQSIKTTKELDYTTIQGIGVLEEMDIVTEQKSDKPGSKALKYKENVKFNNYKLNTGAGLKYFLSEGTKPNP
jgi:hypothetical protein